MPKALKIVAGIAGGIAGVVALGVAGLLIGARFADGPLAIVAGGPFTTGTLVEGPEPDWSFVEGIGEVEFQLLDPERSRTTWILHHGGKAYIPSGYMTTWWGKIWKHWPYEAEKKPAILLRIGDDLYERELVRVTEGPMIEPLLEQLSQKYLGGSSGGVERPIDLVDSGYLWLFELAPRG